MSKLDTRTKIEDALLSCTFIAGAMARELHDATGLHIATVRKHLAEMRKAGTVLVSGGGSKGYLYRLTEKRARSLDEEREEAARLERRRAREAKKPKPEKAVVKPAKKAEPCVACDEPTEVVICPLCAEELNAELQGLEVPDESTLSGRVLARFTADVGLGLYEVGAVLRVKRPELQSTLDELVNDGALVRERSRGRWVYRRRTA